MHAIRLDKPAFEPAFEPPSRPVGAAWLLLPALAAWPHWLWSGRRLLDGSDDPLGIVALGVLLACLWRDRRGLVATPRLPWLALALGWTAAAALSGPWLSPLPRAGLAMVGLLSACMAVRGPGQPLLAWLGLGLLALPILASLQFFAGYPLRVLTAEVSTWLLQAAGLEVVRQGSTLEVAGRLVMVDAPCSGVQMGWLAYCTACTAAAWLRLPDRTFVRRVPVVGLCVLGGNVVRNAVLVVKEAGLVHWPAWTHEAVGLATFACVCALVLAHMARGQTVAVPTAVAASRGGGRAPALPVAARRLRFVLATGFVGLALWPLLATQAAQPVRAPRAALEWPRTFAGRPIRPLALSAVERRFAETFPGAIARFTDGERLLTLRHVEAATRKLHPAADCYRGLGYAIRDIGLEQEPGASGPDIGLQRCFTAERTGRRQRVCEFVEDARGRRFTDTSAWYWAAARGESVGPWQAVTVAAGR